MGKFLLAIVIMLLSVVTAPAWDMKIKVGVIDCEGRLRGSGIRHVSRGRIAGHARQLGSGMNFADAVGKRLPNLNRDVKFIALRYGSGAFICSGKPACPLPMGARCPAVDRQGRESGFDVEGIGESKRPKRIPS